MEQHANKANTMLVVKRVPPISSSQASERKRRRNSETPLKPAEGKRRAQASLLNNGKMKILTHKDIQALGLNVDGKIALNSLIKTNLVQPKKGQHKPNLVARGGLNTTTTTTKIDKNSPTNSKLTINITLIQLQKKLARTQSRKYKYKNKE